jgi:hypothetical protein
MFKSGYSRRCYFPKRTSPQRFDELPDLDHFICPAVLPVIAIPFAFTKGLPRPLCLTATRSSDTASVKASFNAAI